MPLILFKLYFEAQTSCHKTFGPVQDSWKQTCSHWRACQTSTPGN